MQIRLFSMAHEFIAGEPLCLDEYALGILLCRCIQSHVNEYVSARSCFLGRRAGTMPSNGSSPGEAADLPCQRCPN